MLKSKPAEGVFVIKGGYPDLRRGLLDLGWSEATNPETTKSASSPPVSSVLFFSFTIKWTLNARDIDYSSLKEGQVVNHFQRNSEITTKVGLSQNLYSYSESQAEVDQWFPRCYDASDLGEWGDFVSDYMMTKAKGVISRVLRHVVQRQR